MNKWIAEFDLEDGDTMPEHMDLKYKGAKIDFHCKPLEQEPCEDCISRKEAIKTLQDNCNHWNTNVILIDIATNLLKDLPSITPIQEWIPCSEELPKDVGEYLVTISFDIGGKEPVRETRRNYFCSSKKWLHDDDEVIAWMLSPKPYGKESEVEE